MLDPGVVTLRAVKVGVITDGPSEGRTMEDPKGTPIQVALDAD